MQKYIDLTKLDDDEEGKVTENYQTRNKLQLGTQSVEKELQVVKSLKQNNKYACDNKNEPKTNDNPCVDNNIRSQAKIDSYIRQTARKSVEPSLCDKSLINLEKNMPNTQSDKILAEQNQIEKKCDMMLNKRFIRMNFVAEPQIYSKFNIISKNECIKGDSNSPARKIVDTEEKLLSPRYPSVRDEKSKHNSNNEKITASDWYEQLNRVQVIEKNKVENNRLMKVMVNVDECSNDSYVKSLLIKKYGVEVGSQKFNSMTKCVAYKISGTKSIEENLETNSYCAELEGLDEKVAKASYSKKVDKKVILPKIFAKSSQQESETHIKDNQLTKNLSCKKPYAGTSNVEKELQVIKTAEKKTKYDTSNEKQTKIVKEPYVDNYSADKIYETEKSKGGSKFERQTARKRFVKMNFAAEPEIYSKFNIISTNECVEGFKSPARKNFTEEKLQLNKNSMKKLVADRKTRTNTNEEIPEIVKLHTKLSRENLIDLNEKVEQLSKKKKVIKKDFLFPIFFAKSSKQESGSRNENVQTKKFFKEKFNDTYSVGKEIPSFKTEEKNSKYNIGNETQPEIVEVSYVETNSADKIYVAVKSKRDYKFERETAIKTVKKSQSDKLLFGRGTVMPNAKSDKNSATQDPSEQNCDPIKKPVRMKFTTDPQIYSKFNVKSITECTKGNYINCQTAKKNISTQEKLQPSRNCVIIDDNSNSNSKKKVTTVTSCCEYLNRDTKFDKNKLETNKTKKVDNLDDFSADNCMKNLCIKTYGNVVGLEKFDSLTKLDTSKESGTAEGDLVRSFRNKKEYDDIHDNEKALQVLKTAEQKSKSFNGGKQPNILKKLSDETTNDNNIVNEKKLKSSNKFDTNENSKANFDFKRQTARKTIFLNCDKKPVRMNSETESQIYSKFNTKSTNEWLEGDGEDPQSAKKAVTPEHLLPPRYPGQNENSNYDVEKEVKAAPSSFENQNTATTFYKNEVKTNSMTKVMGNVDDCSSDNYLKNLCIKKYGDEVGLQKYIRMTKLATDKTNETITHRNGLNEELTD